MGAWSEDIFGNDTALDCVADVEDILGVAGLHPEELTNDSMRAARSAADSDDVQARLSALIESEDFEPARLIVGQVVCTILMTVGARISDKLRAIGLACATDDYTEWEHPDARQVALESFRRDLESHEEGRVRQVATKSLFQRLAEVLGRA